MAFQHFILTRFLVRMSDAPEDLARVTDHAPEAFAHRMAIFRKACLPTVAAQSEQDFTWLIFFDARAASAYVNEVREAIAPMPNAQVVIVDRFDDEARHAVITPRLRPDVSWLLTTRFDNDDGLHRDFVRVVQQSIRVGTRECLNFPVGVIYWKDKTFLYRHLSNAFVSMSEPVEGMRTAATGPHRYIGRVAPVRQLTAFPAFLQVVHGEQVSNKPRGMRIHRMLAAAGLEAAAGLFTTPDTETDWEILRDNVTYFPVWSARDGLIGRVRALVGRPEIPM